tara:strand:- start:2287 stop:2748 length:462 start_codon:yes stop_codon:yes gene_type:complete
MFKNPQQQSLLLGGVNMAGLLSLTAYTIRTLNETNASLLEMRQELEQIKGTFSENNKRSNVAFSRLNQRIEENVQIVNSQNHLLEGVKKQVRKLKVGELPEVKRPYVIREEPPPPMAVEEISSEEEEEVEIMAPKKRLEQVDEITSALNALMT